MWYGFIPFLNTIVSLQDYPELISSQVVEIGSRYNIVNIVKALQLLKSCLAWVIHWPIKLHSAMRSTCTRCFQDGRQADLWHKIDKNNYFMTSICGIFG